MRYASSVLHVELKVRVLNPLLGNKTNTHTYILDPLIHFDMTRISYKDNYKYSSCSRHLFTQNISHKTCHVTLTVGYVMKLFGTNQKVIYQVAKNTDSTISLQIIHYAAMVFLQRTYNNGKGIVNHKATGGTAFLLHWKIIKFPC